MNYIKYKDLKRINLDNVLTLYIRSWHAEGSKVSISMQIQNAITKSIRYFKGYRVMIKQPSPLDALRHFIDGGMLKTLTGDDIIKIDGTNIISNIDGAIYQIDVVILLILDGDFIRI